MYADVDSTEIYFYAAASGPDSNLYFFQATIKDLVMQSASIVTLTGHGSFVRVKFNSSSNLYVTVLVSTTVYIFSLSINSGNTGFTVSLW